MRSDPYQGYQRVQPMQTGTTEEIAGQQETQQNPVRTFVERLVKFKTMQPALRTLTIAALILVGVAAVVLIGNVIPQPDVLVGLLNGQPLSMPLIDIISAIILLSIGWAYAISGAFQVHWSVRLLIMVIFTWLSASYPQSLLQDPGGWNATGHLAALFQIAVIAGLDVWAILVFVFKRRERQRPQASQSTVQVPTFIIVLALLFGYYLAGAYGSTNSGGIFNGTLGLVAFAANIITQLFFLLAVQNFVVIWSSTDFLEWGDLAARGVIAGVQRLRMTWLVAALPVLVALAILVDALRVIPGLAAAPSIVETIAVVSAGVIVVLLAGIDRTWSSVTQITALFIGALYLFLSDELANELTFLLHLNASDSQQLTNVVTLTLWIAAATLGGILLLWRHGQYASQGRAAGLLLLLIVLFDLPGISHNFVAATGLHASPLPPLNQATFLFLCALISLVVILITALRRSLSDAVPTFVSVLCFLVGVRIVFWVFNLSEHPSLSTQTSAVVVALTFLAAVVWDVLTSGESITNRDSRAFPRAGRILIYLGYTLIAASMFILFSTLRPQVLQASNGSLPLFNLDGPFLAFGITELGIPFVITTFALSLSQRRAAAVRDVPTLVPSGTIIARGAQVAVGLFGIAALLLVDIAVLRAPPPPATLPTYSAHIPGKDCDFKGALWSTANPARCLQNGLEMTEQLSSPGQYSATVLFDLPQPGLATNYRISVHFDLSKLSGAPKDACAALVTHITDAGWYLTQVCRDGSWEINKQLSDQNQQITQTTLKAGSLDRSVSDVTMTMTSDNATYALAINGTQVGSAPDTSLSQTGGAALTTVSPGPGTAILSDFTYTALSKATGSHMAIGHVSKIAHQLFGLRA